MLTLQQKIDQAIVNVPNFPTIGIQYKDITPLFLNPTLSQEIIDAFVQQAQGKVDVVCGIESRGFLYGVQIAHQLNVPFVLIRKVGKLPPPTITVSYELEYGSATIELNKNYIPKGSRVMIHDDILATGGTAIAAAALIEKCEAQVVQFSFIAKLDFLKAEDKLKAITSNIVCLTEF